MKKSFKWRLSLAVQLSIAVFTLWAVGSMYFFTGSGNMRVNRAVIFRYFTVDSNLLCAVSCLFSIAQTVLHGKARRAALLLRYAGTAAVAVTMMTVLLFLGLLYGYASMFAGWNLWLHLLCPLLSIFSFLRLEGEEETLEMRRLPLSLLPVLAYGVVYGIMTVILGPDRGGWPDFYGFNRTGHWYVSYAAMVAATLLIGWALLRLRKKPAGPAA